MPQVHANPEQLNAFANKLSQFIDNLNSETQALDGAFSSLGETWQDEKRAKFEDEFRDLVRQMSQFESTCSEYIPYLQALASQLEIYIQS